MSVSRQIRRQMARQAAKGKAGPLRRNYDQMKAAPAEILLSCALIDAGGQVHVGFKSHSELRRSLGRTNPYDADPSDTYGFWTSNERFVDRAEAARIHGWTAQRELLSSDVW